MTLSKQTCGMLAAVIAALVISAAPAQAKKPDNPGGGGGGGGDGGGNQLELIDLHPTGSNSSQAYAINNTGIAVGSVDNVAGFWDTTAATATFAALSGSALSANAINANGAIVGEGPGPTYWANPTATPISLPLPPGYTGGFANGISRDGIVVGAVSGGTNGTAVAWRVTGSTVFGPVFLPGASSVRDVASLQSGTNRVVGRSAEGPTSPATAWDLNLQPDGSFSVAGSTVLTPGQPSVAYAITEQGDVSGQFFGTSTGANLNTVEEGAFVIRNGSLTLLDGGGGNRRGIGFDLNDTDVVGATARYYWSVLRYATLWNSPNRPENLSDLYFDENWSRAIAHGINDGGDIVGYGDFGEEGHAWMLRAAPMALSAAAAVPEPSTLALAMVTLLGLSFRGKRMEAAQRNDLKGRL